MRLRTTLALIFSAFLAQVPVRAAQVSGEVEMGYQKRDISANEAYAEKYGEIADGAVIPSVSVDVSSGGSKLHVDAQNLRQDNQSVNVEYNRNYKLKVEAAWDQTPHVYSNVATTLYNEVAPGVFQLPDPVQTAIQSTSTARLPTVLNSYWAGAHPVELKTLDSKGSVKVGYVASEHTKFNVGFSEDNIQGHKPWGGSFSTALLTQLPAPVDYKVYNMNAGSQYNTKTVQLGFSYLLSAFQNQVESLTWENSRQLNDGTLTAGTGSSSSNPGIGRQNLAPDNWSHTFNLNAGVNLPAKTRFTASSSMGYMRQNQDLLPYTINSRVLISTRTSGAANANLRSSLPEETANAKIITWTQDYALNNRIIQPVSLGVHYHSYQLINRTSDVTFDGQVPADTAWEADPGSNGRFQFRKDMVEGSIDYDIFNPLSLGVRYATEWVTRNHRETRNTTEKTLTVTSDFKPAGWMLLRGTYVHAHRRPQDLDISNELDESGDGTQLVAEDLPGLRRYDVSDRLRNQGKVLWQITPNSPINVGVHASLTHDNFQPGIGDLTGGISSLRLSSSTTNASAYTLTQQNQMYGLLENRDASAGIDIGIDVSERLAFDLYYDYEETKALQRSNDNNVGIPLYSAAGTAPTNSQDAGTDWLLREVDRYQMAGISARINRASAPVSFKVGYDITMSRGASDFLTNSVVQNPALASTTGTVSIATPPDTKFTKQDVSVKTNIRMNSQWSVMLGYLYEKYDVTNWQQQVIPSYVSSGALYLGTNLQNYVAHVGSIVFKYKF